MNAGGGDKGYRDFDVENMEPKASSSTKVAANSSGSSPWGRRCCSLPVLLASAALVCSLVALACGIYAAAVVRRGRLSSSDEGVFLTTNPRSREAVNLYRGTGYFARQPPMLYPRSDHKSVPLGNTVYLLGGLTNALELDPATADAAPDAAPAVPLVLNATVAYDTYTETSRQLAPMPQPRFRFCAAELRGQLYVVGGMPAFEAATAETHGVSDRVMRYTPSTNRWETLPGRLNHPRGDCCAAAVGGKLYVAGGWTTDYADTLGSVEVFDPAAAGGAGSWSFMPNMTLPRGDCEAVALEHKMLMVIGGVATDGNFTASVETLDVTAASPQWTARASMSKPRGDFAAEALPGGRVIVMGGETRIVAGGETEFALHDVEEYSSASDRWVMKAPLPEARFRFDTAHVGERVYVFGGQPTCSSKGDGGRNDCVKVALDTVYGFFDVRYPDVYAVFQDKA